MYWPRCRSACIWSSHRWASTLRVKFFLRCRPPGSRHRACQPVPRGFLPMLAISRSLELGPGPRLDRLRVETQVPPDPHRRRATTAHPPLVDRADGNPQVITHILQRPQSLRFTHLTHPPDLPLSQLVSFLVVAFRPLPVPDGCPFLGVLAGTGGSGLGELDVAVGVPAGPGVGPLPDDEG